MYSCLKHNNIDGFKSGLEYRNTHARTYSTCTAGAPSRGRKIPAIELVVGEFLAIDASLLAYAIGIEFLQVISLCLKCGGALHGGFSAVAQQILEHHGRFVLFCLVLGRGGIHNVTSGWRPVFQSRHLDDFGEETIGAVLGYQFRVIAQC